MTFIISNINWSTNFVQYQRFKRERSEIIEKVANNEPMSEARQESAICSICKDKSSKKGARKLRPKQEKGFINDVKWMLEYNQNGLMQLIIYIINISYIAIQTITCFLYSTFPTNRHPITQEFINPWLRYADKFALTDFIHEFDPKGRYNRILGILACQCLILRLRAFYSRLKTAKANRYRYKEINIVEIEYAYAEEHRLSQRKALSSSLGAFGHKCNTQNSLSGRARKRTLEFNRKVRCLDKIDRLYYYNQIDFNDCSRGSVEVFAGYNKQIKEIDEEPLTKRLRGKRNSNDNDYGNYSDNDNKTKLTWFQYLTSFNLPNKVSYIAMPEQRIEFRHTFFFYFGYLFGVTLISAVILLSCATLSYLAVIHWNGRSTFALTLYLIRSNLTIAFIILAVYDSTLLGICLVIFLSRASKIVKLLENQIEFYRYHLRQVSKIIESNQQYIDFKTNFLNLPNISTGFRKRFKDREKFSQNKDSSLNRSEFSFIRKHHSIKNALTYAKISSVDDVISIYKRSLHQSDVVHFNENIDYLLDLIEVIQFELSDHKRFFTLLLDVNVIFGTLGCSISIGVFAEASDTIGYVVTFMAFMSFLTPMLFSLSIGASSEAAVSIATDRLVFYYEYSQTDILTYLPLRMHDQLIAVYRRLRPLLVDELEFLSSQVATRLFKICSDLVHSENRSFIVLGNFPLSFGSLASVSFVSSPSMRLISSVSLTNYLTSTEQILVWIVTCAIIFHRFL